MMKFNLAEWTLLQSDACLTTMLRRVDHANAVYVCMLERETGF